MSFYDYQMAKRTQKKVNTQHKNPPTQSQAITNLEIKQNKTN